MTEDPRTFDEYERGFGLDAAREEAWRCLQCQDPPCEQGCPATVRVRKFIRKIRNLDFFGAALCIRQDNVLGGSCARVCATAGQCQRQCTRSKMDRAIDIGGLQRFVCDWEMGHGAAWGPAAGHTGKQVAVIGAGPAGLAAAAELALLGHKATVFEAGEKPGGMLIHGIPAMRLPHQVIEHEVEAIAGLGVEFKLDYKVSDLDQSFDATVVAVGLTRGIKLKIPGEDLEGVHAALNILKAKGLDNKPRLGKRVLVIGGGNTAMDAATTALRLGAEDVCVLYRRGDFEMPAWKKEVDRAREEGISIRTHTAPVAFVENDGRVTGVRCIVTVHGPPDQSGRRRPVAVEGCEFDLEADDVIVAAGETIDADLAAGLGLSLGRDGLVECADNRSTPTPGVFAAGDLTRWDRTVVQAVADGRQAARSVHEFFNLGTVEPQGLEVLPPEVDMSVDFCGVRLIHPFVLAAAPPTDDLDMLRAGFEAGWAGAVLKTTAVESEPVDLKYPMMTGYEVAGRRVVGLGNIDLISEHHIDVVEERVRALKKEFPDRVIIGSIMGSARQDWETLVSRLEAAGADVIECSFSCPQGTLGGEGSFAGQMLGQNVELTREVTSWIKGAAKRCPVVIKITPQVADIAAVSRAVKQGGADAVCASNTIPALMGIDPESFTPLPDVGGQTSFSGLSGPAILPITLRNIALVAQHSTLPIAGTGGPVHYLDAAQMMLVGAAYVQFCTAVMTFGYDIVEDLVSGLGWYLQERGLSSPSQLVGRALDRITTHDRLVTAGKIRSRIDEHACINCGRCHITCRDGGHLAIGFAADRRPVVDDDKCVGCGMCAAVCPVSGCIRMAAV
jgi:dihydropyrimidine dehydrogenase (NAD+) subunit PreA